MKPLLCALFFFLSFSSFGQTTTSHVYDVVYMKDGRVLFGEIIQFEIEDGDITFKDKYGRMYSITRKEYNYFVEDKEFKEKQRDTVIYARKFNELEVEIGLSESYVQFAHELTTDSYFLSSNWNGSFGFIPTSIHLGAGKYFERKLYAGVETDFGVLTSAKPMFQAGLTGRYQYDKHTSNTAKYVSVQLHYQSVGTTISYGIADSTYNEANQTYEYPGTVKVPVTLNGIRLGVGHGFQFQLDQLRSFAIELNMYKQFYVSNAISVNGRTPSSEWTGMGARLLFCFRF